MFLHLVRLFVLSLRRVDYCILLIRVPTQRRAPADLADVHTRLFPVSARNFKDALIF